MGAPRTWASLVRRSAASAVQAPPLASAAAKRDSTSVSLPRRSPSAVSH